MKRIILYQAIFALISLQIAAQKKMDSHYPFNEVVVAESSQEYVGSPNASIANNTDFSKKKSINTRSSLDSDFETTELWGTCSESERGLGGVFKLNGDGSDYELVLEYFADEGYRPEYSTPIIIDDLVYGLTRKGGINAHGILFRCDLDGNNYTVLHHFEENDGIGPRGKLLYQDGKLFGLTNIGGVNGWGTIFSYSIGSGEFEVVHHFEQSTGGNPQRSNGSLVSINNTIYGLTAWGGTINAGVLFSFEIATNSYSVLYEFTGNDDGRNPMSGLSVFGRKLYGCTNYASTHGNGALFSYDIDTEEFEVLHSFADGISGSLLQYGGFLYGTALYGGDYGSGYIYSFNTGISTFNILYHFDSFVYSEGQLHFEDGVLFGLGRYGGQHNHGILYSYNLSLPSTEAFEILIDFWWIYRPSGSLFEHNGLLYALADYGGQGELGSLFSYDIEFSEFFSLHEFNAPEGATPKSSLIEHNEMLYGMTYLGGDYGNGTLFSLDPNSLQHTVLHHFSIDQGGGYPWSSLVEYGGMLYGTACWGGGESWSGSIFSFDPLTNEIEFLYQLDNTITNGHAAFGDIIVVDNVLYGTTLMGGDYDLGVIYSFDLISEVYTTLLDFDGVNGSNPEGGLIEADGVLIGTASSGGDYNQGTMFSINPDGTEFNLLRHLDPETDGGRPRGKLTFYNNQYFGLNSNGGGTSGGTAFSSDDQFLIESFEVIHQFDWSNELNGAAPYGSFAELNGMLFGTTRYGGADMIGTVFSLDPVTHNFNILHSFDGIDGYCPYRVQLLVRNYESVKTAGNTEIFGSSTTVANRRTVPITFDEAGTIQSITMYHNGGGGDMLLGVYNDASGLPGTRLGVTLETPVSGSSGWQTVSLSSPLPVDAGQTVWLAWVFESNPGIRYEVGTPGRANSPETWSGGMPVSFGSSTMGNFNYSIYCTYTPTPPSCYPLGNTEIFSTTTTATNRRAVPVTVSEAGLIESISIYHDAGSGNMLLGVYNDASGLPETQLGVTPSTPVNGTAGWQTIPLTTDISVSAGETVWLAWVFESNPGIRYEVGTPGRANSPETWSGGMPPSFGSSTMGNYNYSIYCTICPSTGVDPCDNIIAISGCGPENSQTFVSEGSGSWYSDSENPCGQPSYGQEQIYSFTAPATGTYNLMVTETSGDYVDYLWKTGSCSSSGWECLNDISEPGSWASREWEEGTTYYILLDDEDTEPSTHTFYLECESSSSCYPLGNTGVFGTSTTVANRRAVPITASEDGWIESIVIYHNGGSGGMMLGVYSDASGSPGSRLALAPSTTVNSSEGWQTSTLSTPVSVTAGETVWLAWVFESNPGIRYVAGSTPRANSPETWSGGMPASFGSSSMANYSYSIYCIFCPSGSKPKGTLGNLEVFESTTTVANRRAVPVTASEPGSVESISIYHEGGSGDMLLGVYSDASGLPNTRLGVTPVTTVGGSSGWQTVDLSSDVSVSAGQTVWLAWVFESNPGIRYTTGTPGRAHSSQTWSAGMPTSFGSSTMANYIYSIYCTYSTGGTKAANIIQGVETDTQDGDQNQFLIYPNPTSGKLTVTWNHEYKTDLVLTLVNSIGEKVKVLNIEPNWGEVELDLGDYHAGMYFIMISDPGEGSIIHRGKVIKSR